MNQNYIIALTSRILNLSYLSLITLFFLSSLTQLASAGGESDGFQVTQVEEGIYLHAGQHVSFSHSSHDDIANIGFIIGEKCIAVIDTGGSVSIGNSLLQSIREISKLPICYVINTHVHFDHLLGNLAFSEEKPEYVGHNQLKDAVEQSKDFFLDQFKDGLGPNPTQASIIGPTLLVTDSLELDLGGRTLRLTAYETAHSQTDLTVLDLKTRTLWAGDLIFRERIPALDGKLKGWLAVLKEMEKEDIKLLIPGHGTTSNEWPLAYQPQETYLNSLLVKIRAFLAEGSFLEEVIEKLSQEGKDDWLLHEQHHHRNVTKAFTELEWE